MALPILNFETRPQEPIEDTPRKDKTNSRTGTPRARITPENGLYIAFAGKFPCANAEAFSMLAHRQDSRLAPGGVLPTVKGTESKLRKLINLQAIERYRLPTTGETLYGASQSGMGFAEMYDYNMYGARRLEGISHSRTNHFKMIAHVAAQLLSPEGYFKESLGLEPVTLDQLVTEKAMIQNRQPIRKLLDEQAKQGANPDFGKWRATTLKQSIEQVQAGRLDWEDLIEANPALLSIGYPQVTGSKLKDLHQPDLVLLGDRNGPKSENTLIEIELSKKLFPEYDAILATLAKEFTHPFIYSRAVYFTVGNEVETLLRKVDRAGGYNLFDTGKLVVLPLKHRDGKAITKNQRILIGE